jgi:hypothetical protein
MKGSTATSCPRLNMFGTVTATFGHSREMALLRLKRHRRTLECHLELGCTSYHFWTRWKLGRRYRIPGGPGSSEGQCMGEGCVWRRRRRWLMVQ